MDVVPGSAREWLHVAPEGVELETPETRFTLANNGASTRLNARNTLAVMEPGTYSASIVIIPICCLVLMTLVRGVGRVFGLLGAINEMRYRIAARGLVGRWSDRHRAAPHRLGAD